MSYDVECPYCGEEQEINHDDGYVYEDGRRHKQQCWSCEKTFVYTYDYDVEKADCLNGGEHKFQPTLTYPKECTRMECTECGQQRTPTEDEFKKIMEGDQ